MIDISKALLHLRPGASWSMSNDDYKTLWWSDDNELPPPTEEELINVFENLQFEHERYEYQRKRATEYPPITDYIDGVVKGDQEQIQAYIDACQAVKAKYPKPE
jgi:hypothetical protein